MKRKSTIVLSFTALAIFLGYEAMTNSGGAPSGSSGAPPSNASCARSGCHVGGPAISSESVQITTDIPSAGFAENQSYQITVTANDGGRNLSRIGFQASVQDGASSAGTAVVSDPGSTQKVGDAITHTFNGLSATNGENSWTFDWNSGTAPDQTTVYVAVNFANGNGSTSGDVIVSETLVLNKESGLSLSQPVLPSYEVYPNPVKEMATISSGAPLQQPQAIYNAKGKTLALEGLFKLKDPYHAEINTSNWSKGVYFVSFEDGSVARLIKE